MATTTSIATTIAGRWRRTADVVFAVVFAGKRLPMGCACEIAMHAEMPNAGAMVFAIWCGLAD